MPEEAARGETTSVWDTMDFHRTLRTFSRHYRLLSLCIVIVAAIMIGFIYRSVVGSRVTDLAVENSSALATILAHHLEDSSHSGLDYQTFVASASSMTPDEIRNHRVTQETKKIFSGMLKGVSVAKIKIYDRKGTTIFSTDPADIGENIAAADDYRKALAGNIQAELVKEGDDHAFMPGRKIIESYIPVHPHGNPAEAPWLVFEVYQDLTSQLDHVAQWEKLVMLGVGATLLLAYFGLITIVEPANRLMRIQHDENEKLARAVEQSSSMVVITDPDGVIEYVNPRFTEITGYSEDEAVGQTPAMIKSGLTDNETYRKLWNTLKAGDDWEGEIQNRRKDGSVYWEFQTISPIKGDDGMVTHYVAIKEDITGRKDAEAQIQHLALYDSLTELANRFHFMQRLQAALDAVKRDGGRGVLLFMDLDEFKDVNDTLGHPAGDAVLYQAARRLEQVARRSDLVARVGGDEFAILATGVAGTDFAAELSQRIIQVLSEPFHLDTGEVYIGASVGIAVFPDDGLDPEQVLRNADLALYRAKNDGRGTFRFFSINMDTAILRRKQISRGLQPALEQGQFELHYQPVVNLETGHLVGMEALIRWQHPELGPIRPDEFIPIAEQTRTIVDIGRWVIREACRQIRAWQGFGIEPVPIAVNLSGVEFQTTNIAETVSRILEEEAVDPKYLHIEITERIALDCTDETLEALEGLRQLGLKISLDDFGAGYSSLGSLRKMPIDKVKMDKTFVDDLHEDQRNLAIVEAVIRMGNALGMTVLAEGVEHGHQLDVLRALGCQEVQGYVYSKAVPAALFKTFLTDGVTALLIRDSEDA